MSSNLSRRAFLSSVGVAAAAPSVVANAIKEACVPDPPDVFCSWTVDWETIRTDGYFGSSYYIIVLTPGSDKVQYIPIHDQLPNSLPLDG